MPFRLVEIKPIWESLKTRRLSNRNHAGAHRVQRPDGLKAALVRPGTGSQGWSCGIPLEADASADFICLALGNPSEAFNYFRGVLGDLNAADLAGGDSISRGS